ncbi:MAG: hypothetical protein HY349_04810 [Nitrospirae bacterium]|nr:hypothetical protein [Nitrospirota bacterium]
MKRVALASGILCCLVIGALPMGCATIDDLSTESYRKFGFPSEPFEGEGLGLLPLFSRSSLRDYLPRADAIFVEALRQQRSGRVWIDPQESLSRIRQSGLESLYQDLTREYSVDRPPRQEPLERIGKAVGARYLLLTELQRIEMTEGATQVRLAGRIFDTEQGEILWEGIGEGRGYVVLIFPWIPSSFEKTMAIASNGLIHRLP